MYKISIIVPVYNAEKHLKRCIDSILSQTFTDFECILVNDCSTDSTSIICDEYAQKDRRIKIINNVISNGSSISRKIGFENSSGEYIQFIDADDWIESNMLEKLYSTAITGNYDMLCCDWYNHNLNNEIIYKKMPSVSNDFISNIKNIILLFGLKGAVWNKLIKRTVYENINFPKEGYFEDKYIITQALYFSKSIMYLNMAFYHYVSNIDSWVHDKKRRIKRYNGMVINFSKIINFLKEKNGNDLNEFEPELNNMQLLIKKRNPKLLKNIIKRVIRLIIPIKVWRICLKKTFIQLW